MKLFIILLLVTATSCTRMVLKKMGAIGGKPVIQEINVKKKDVLFLGMTHLSQQDFYTKSKKVIDSLSGSGYYIFGEGTEDSLNTQIGKSLKEVQKNIILKKFRKVSNLPINKSQLIYFGKMIKKYELKVQPKDLYFFKDTTKAISVDNSLAEQIKEYEKIRGEIRLDSCDISTNIGDEYKCQQLDKNEQTYFKKEIIINFRNNLVIDAVKKSNKKKILIIYGKAHFEGIKKGLEN